MTVANVDGILKFFLKVRHSPLNHIDLTHEIPWNHIDLTHEYLLLLGVLKLLAGVDTLVI